MNENKFDKMMKAYCNHNTAQFEFKEKKTKTLKYTSVLAATIVLVILITILIIPQPSSEKDLTLTVSAATTEEMKVYKVKGSEVSNPGVSMKIKGNDIEKIVAYSEKGDLALGICGWSSKYSIIDLEHKESVQKLEENTPPPLLVIPYEKDSNGKLDIVSSDKLVPYIEIVDEQRIEGEKLISLLGIPIDDNGEEISFSELTEDFNDTIVVEITYLDGTKETKSKSVTIEDFKN